MNNTISPYHAHRQPTLAKEMFTENLLHNLPIRFNPERVKASLPFLELADALEALNESRSKKSLQIQILKTLFSRIIEVAGPDNATLEMYLVLKMLMPAEDHESVYGMKTNRIMRCMSTVMDKLGRPEAGALLKQWLTNPQAQMSIMGRGIVSMPELVIASQCAKISGSSVVAKPLSPVTLQDIAALCKTLTTAYLTMSFQTPGAETSQVESLFQVLGYNLSFKEWTLLTRILLKQVSVGVGKATVLSVIPNGSYSFSRQHDLGLLAEMSTSAMLYGRKSPIVCGIPFIPMACDSLKSPYLLRWLFSKEELLSKPISPVNGRLIILGDGKWCVPVNASQKSKFVNLANDLILQKPTSKKHFLLLREFQHNGLINGSEIQGMVLHYTLSEEENGNTFVMLLRALSDAKVQNIELVDVYDQYLVQAKQDDEDFFKNVNMIESTLQSIIAVDQQLPEKLKDKLKVIISIKKNNKGNKASANFTSLRQQNARPKSKALNKLAESIAAKNTNLKNIIKQSSAATKNQVYDEESMEESIIVQLKYDGDRIQAHISKIGDNDLQVKLYTKWGKNVSEMYSNVRDELQGCLQLAQHAPCILDGELIVIDSSTENPLPWCSEKWKHNVYGKPTLQLSDFLAERSGDVTTSSSDPVISLVYDGYSGGEATVNNSSDEMENSQLAFATLKGLKKWKGMGPTEKKNIRGRVIEGGRLRLIIFDILMYRGDIICEKSCSIRLNILQSQLKPLMKNALSHTRVIEESYNIKTSTELINLLRKSVELKQEGYVLKDPSAAYVFGKTKVAQKVKLTGPDINTVVIGLGFSLSSNPRRWGILTGIAWDKEESERSKTRKNTFASYCRTEVLEGDQPWKAFEHIIALPSKVKLIELENTMQKSQEVDGIKVGIIELDKYTVKMKSIATSTSTPATNMRKIEWISRSKENSVYNCEIVLLHKSTIDIQWLCNPIECAFGLSIRGDLRPIESDSFGLKTFLHPRHPVARVEIVGHQISQCDTNNTIITKFESAQNVDTCIEEYTFRRIKRLRSLPPSQQNLEEIRRTTMILRELKNVSLDKTQKEIEWPQPPPLNGTFTLDDFSSLLEEVAKYPSSVQSEQETALLKLSPDERLAITGLRVHSQWQTMSSTVMDKTSQLDTEEDAEANAKHIANIEFLSARLKQFSEKYSNSTGVLIRTSSKFNPPPTLTAVTPLKTKIETIISIPILSSHANIYENLTSLIDEDEDDDENDIEEVICQEYCDGIENEEMKSPCMFGDDVHLELYDDEFGAGSHYGDDVTTHTVN